MPSKRARQTAFARGISIQGFNRPTRRARSGQAVLAMLSAFAVPSLMAGRSASALTNVTLSSTAGSPTVNYWGSGLWSDGSNPNVSTGTPSPYADFYNVSSGQILYAPKITNASVSSNFYGGGLALTGATLNFNVSSNGNITENYYTPNSSTGIQATDSTLSFSGTNTVHFQLQAPLNVSDTGTNTNIITVSGTSPSQYLLLNGAISGSGILTFQFTGTETGRAIAYNASGGTYTGNVILGATPGSATLTLNQNLGTVPNYTVGTNWTLADANDFTSGANATVNGILRFAGASESLGNLTGSGIVYAANTSTAALTLGGAGTFSGTLNTGTGTLNVTKTGSGTQILSGTTVYSGTTNISAGTLTFGKEVSLYDNSTGSWTGANITVGTGATLGLNVGGTGQFTAGDVGTLLTNLGTGTGGFQPGSAIALDTTGGSITYATPIPDANGGASSIGLTKLGTNSLTLQGSSTYTGPTTVSAGTLILDSSSTSTSIAASATTLAGGATLLVKGNSATGALTVIGGSTAATQGTIDLRDGTINTLAINGNLALGSSSLGSILGFDLGTASGSNDELNVTGGVATAGITTINLNALGTLAYGNYTLISDTTGGLSSSAFVLGARPSGPNYSFSSSTVDALVLTVSAAATTPTVAYWTGLASAAGGNTANSWGYIGSPTNWSSTSNGLTDTGAQPGSITNVIFSAANATGVSGVLSTQLDNSYSINSLTFDTSPAPSLTSVLLNTNGYTLTLGAGGLLLNGTDTSGATINGSSATIVLGSSQTWANNSSSYVLTINAGVAGSAGNSSTQTLTFGGNGSGGVVINGVIADGFNGGNTALVFNQTGVTQVNGANTFTGGVTLDSGTIHLGSTGALNAVTGNNLTFGPGTTADLQLNGNSTRVLSLNSDPTTLGTPVIENANAAAATLTALIVSGTSTYAGVLRDGTGGGSLGLTVNGGGTLVLSGSNSYTGATTLTGGTLVEATSTSLPAVSAIVFNGPGTLNMSGQAFSPPSLTVAGGSTFTAAITATPNFTWNSSGTTIIGATNSAYTNTLDLTAVSTFNYNGTSSSVMVIGGGTAVGGSGALLLGPAAHITTGTLDLGTSPTGLTGGYGYSTAGTLTLGTTTTINANTITIGNHASGSSIGTLNFASGLTNPTVTIAGYAGGSSKTNMVVGESASSDYATSTGSVDLSAGTVNATLGTLSIGIHTYNNLNFDEQGVGSFTMGAGTVSATTIILGQTVPGGSNAGRITSLASGTFNLGTGSITGGTLQVGTLTMGDQQTEKTSTSAVTSVFNFNSGLLEAAVIQPGATATGTAGAVMRSFNWNGGTIQNYNSTTGISISIPTIAIAGSGNQTFDITLAQTGTVSSNMSGGGIIKADTGTLTLSGSNTYAGGTNITGGTLAVASAIAFPSASAITIAPGAKFAVANHSTNAVIVPTTNANNLTNNGTIDITNNALVVQNGNPSTIFTQIQAGYNGGAWNGTNTAAGVITSSVAAADSTHLTAVGYATGFTTFENQSVNNTDVLIKYTYYGDTNLDGQVDGSDYSRIDNAVLNNSNSSNTQLTGWYNGDFNYDGVINGSDYTLIDNAYNTQGAALADQIASPTAQIAGITGTSSVPEPTALGLCLIGATGLLGRRRRRV